jgi:hypothetical protein
VRQADSAEPCAFYVTFFFDLAFFFKAAELFGLSKTEQALLNEVPHRGSQMPPTDPLIYRFYELVMVNGPALKVLIEGSSATASCRRSISIWRWSASPTRKGIG